MKFCPALEVLERGNETRLRRQGVQKLKERYETLTAREREVMGLLVSGLLTKQIASRLGTSEITAQVHRGQVMKCVPAPPRNWVEWRKSSTFQ